MGEAAKLRAWWWARQGLDGSLRGKPPAEILQATGWARSVGGAGPYLSLFARGGLSRQQVDDAVGALEIHELPSARGCTYVLPAADFGLGLLVGQGFGDDQTLKTALRLGVTEAEIERLGQAVVRALAGGPLSTDELRGAVGDAARSLGPEGTRKGVTTTLPVALGVLQTTGAIRRVPTNGRLDQQRYRYALWDPNPLDQLALDREQALTELARRYFQWAGPATLAELQWFSGLSGRAARKAVEPLGLVPYPPAPERLMFPDELAPLQHFTPPTTPCYVLVSNLDALFLLRRDFAGCVAPRFLAHPLLREKSAQPGGGLADGPYQAIVDRGSVVGFWEYDPDAAKIVFATFQPPDAEMQRAIELTEAFAREDLGDVRMMSLDSPKARAPRLAALRAAG
ncbi:MAG: crosslink repair DNA glycosylase YcaQ family protein [Chloroflexota bacterium]